MRVPNDRLFLRLAFCFGLLSPVLANAQNPGVTVNVDANANRHAIHPNIYGVAHATTAQLNDLNSPLNRNGGNNTTRYNWQLNTDNRGNDWYYVPSPPNAPSSVTVTPQ